MNASLEQTEEQTEPSPDHSPIDPVDGRWASSKKYPTLLQRRAFAGLWIRTVAAFTDLLFFVLFSGMVYLHLSDWLADTVFEQTPSIQIALFLISALFYLFILTLYFEKTMTTPGRAIFSICILDATSMGKPTTAQFIKRHLYYTASFMPLMLGFFWIIFDARKQGWHDKLSNTVILRTTYKKPKKITRRIWRIIMILVVGILLVGGFVLFMPSIVEFLHRFIIF